MKKRIVTVLVVLIIAFAVVALALPNLARVSAGGIQYVPQARNLTITAVPLAVHEMQDNLDYLKDDFGSGGILDGKEVYGFYPSTITVFRGDTVNLTLINPADDDHTFTVSGIDANVVMKGKATTKFTFVATQSGIFNFYCNEAEHAPYMWGQIVVLPDSQAASN
jgi:plastocyanin